MKGLDNWLEPDDTVDLTDDEYEYTIDQEFIYNSDDYIEEAQINLWDELPESEQDERLKALIAKRLYENSTAALEAYNKYKGEDNV